MGQFGDERDLFGENAFNQDAFRRDEGAQATSSEQSRAFPFFGLSRYSQHNLFRGDDKFYEDVFSEGFKARRQVPIEVPFYHRLFPSSDLTHALTRHVYNSSGYQNHLISTTESLEIAGTYPNDPFNTRTYQEPRYAYVIDRYQVKDPLDVVGVFKRSGKMSDYVTQFYDERETAIPNKIKNTAIKGAYPVEWDIVERNGDFEIIHGDVMKEHFIPNPQYRPGFVHTSGLTALSLLGKAGKVITPVAALQDGYSLYTSYDDSQAKGDYRPFYRDTAAVASGWSCAYAGGLAGVEAGSFAGPWGVFSGALLGPIAGYAACSSGIKYVYELNRDKEEAGVPGEGKPYLGSYKSAHFFKSGGKMNHQTTAGEAAGRAHGFSAGFSAESGSAAPKTRRVWRAEEIESAFDKEAISLLNVTYRAKQGRETLSPIIEFVQMTSNRLNAFKPDGAPKQYQDLQSAMEDHGYFSHTASTFTDNHLSEEDLPLYNAMSYELFKSHFKLNEKGELVATDKSVPTDNSASANESELKEELAETRAHLESLHEAQAKDINDIKEAVFASHGQLNELVTRQMGNPSTFLTPAERKSLHQLSENFQHLGSIMANTTHCALMLGGHARTWRAVGGFGQGLMTASAGFSAMSKASSPMSLAGIGGCVSIAVGALSAVMSLLGSDDGKDMGAAIMEAIQALHADMIRGFNQLHRAITENSAVILARLHEVNAKLDRLEKRVSVSFQELHSQSLIDIVDPLAKSISGEFSLKNDEKQNYLRRLSTWIDHHSKAQIQTSLAGFTTDAAKSVEVLGSPDFDIAAMLPFFLEQLRHTLPKRLASKLPNIELPNLVIVSQACEIYINAISHFNSADNPKPLLERTKAIFKAVREIINTIKKDPEFVEVLMRQYDDCRFHVGRAITPCLTGSGEISLAQSLKPGANQEILQSALNDMELRRLILIRLHELCQFNDKVVSQIDHLESKRTILTRSTKDYLVYNQKRWTYVNNHLDFSRFKKGLEMGILTDDNSHQYVYDQWLTYIIWPDVNRVSRSLFKLLHRPIMLHLLLTLNGVAYRDRIGSRLMPRADVLMFSARDYRLFEIMILLCADGLSWPEEYVYKSENNPFVALGRRNRVGFELKQRRLSHVVGAEWKDLVLRGLKDEIKNSSSLLNHQDLRKAYQFYKAIEAGKDASKEGVSLVCLLVLTAILDDLRPLFVFTDDKPLVRSALREAKLTPSGFTIELLAIHCGSKNALDLFRKLNHYAARDDRAFFSRRHELVSIMIAVESEHWEIAKELSESFNPADEKEKSELAHYKEKIKAALANPDLTEERGKDRVFKARVKAPLYTLADRPSEGLQFSPHNAFHELLRNSIDKIDFALSLLKHPKQRPASVERELRLGDDLRELLSFIQELSVQLKRQGSSVSDGEVKAILDRNQTLLKKALGNVKTVFDYQAFVETLKVMQRTLRAIELQLKMSDEVQPYKLSSEVSYATDELKDFIRSITASPESFFKRKPEESTAPNKAQNEGGKQGAASCPSASR